MPKSYPARTGSTQSLTRNAPRMNGWTRQKYV